jgi:type IV pilus assembly protein PilB
MDEKNLAHFATILIPDQLLNAQQNHLISENELLLTADEAPLIHYVNKVLETAVEHSASDIHLEPQHQQLRIRFRIDGLLYTSALLPGVLSSRILSRLKIMAQLDIAERRIPQDGQFQMTTQQKKIDCRVSTCPTLYGEKAMIRILDGNKQVLDLDQLGMNAAQMNLFNQALQHAHGMILVTGPTGSGKTITLYTALNRLNDVHLNITSIEDPVEIYLEGINQVNVNRKAGLNFSIVLRALLRQDPDVIMVGEMRDRETAEIGMHAAQTGHLVLSTLHTNSAAETLTRLINMGIPAYDLVSSIRLIIAQRLIRRLCPHCKTPEKIDPELLSELNLDLEETELWTASGCQYCIGGYQGRTGVFEMLPITPELIQEIIHTRSSVTIAKRASELGFPNLQQSTLEKLKLGIIDLKEMRRVV